MDAIEEDDSKRCKNVFESQDLVEEKYTLRINNKQIYRVKSRNSKGVSSVIVTKEAYDKIRENRSYNFKVEKKSDRKYYLVEFEEVAKIVPKNDNLKRSDFDSARDVNVSMKVCFAYELKRSAKFSMIKLVGVVKIEGEYCQIDVLVDLANSTCFGFTSNDDNAYRVSKALTEFFKLCDKWCSVEVQCVKSSTNGVYYKMQLSDNRMEEVEEDEAQTLDYECSNTVMCNVSYKEKEFRMESLQRLECKILEYSRDGRSKKMIKFMMYTKGGEFEGVSFLSDNINDDLLQEILSDVMNVNMDIGQDHDVYCVMHKRPCDAKYVVQSIMCHAPNGEFYTVFQSN